VVVGLNVPLVLFFFSFPPAFFFPFQLSQSAFFFLLVNENFFCPFPGFFVFFAHCLRRLWPRGGFYFSQISFPLSSRNGSVAIFVYVKHL